ncbi:MAG: vWA domain-containing protein [Gemmatimonadota bacterium]
MTSPWSPGAWLGALAGLEFATPWAFAALAALPLWWWRTRRGAVPALLHARAVTLLAGAGAGRVVPRLLVALRALVIVAMVVALARPRVGRGIEDVTREGISIVVALDISSSMLAEDFQPQNRLEVAKEKLKQFVAGRPNDRVGLVAFAGEALTQVPLAADQPVLMAAADNLQAGMLEDGTAIGTASATAANRLRDAPGASRVLILLTDGENNRGAIDPRTAAQAAAQLGVRIYTVGVGTDGMAPVPVGRGLFGLRYENRPVRIDEALLQDVAKTNGGRYFRARDGAALQRIYEQIDQLERSPVRARQYVQYEERWRWPLGRAWGLRAVERALRAWRGPVP